MGKREIIGGALLCLLASGGAAMTQVGAAVFPHHENLIFYLGVAVSIVAAIGLIVLFFWPRRGPQQPVDVPHPQSPTPRIEIGEADSVTFSRNKSSGDRPFFKAGKTGKATFEDNDLG